MTERERGKSARESPIPRRYHTLVGKGNVYPGYVHSVPHKVTSHTSGRTSANQLGNVRIKGFLCRQTKALERVAQPQTDATQYDLDWKLQHPLSSTIGVAASYHGFEQYRCRPVEGKFSFLGLPRPSFAVQTFGNTTRC